MVGSGQARQVGKLFFSPQPLARLIRRQQRFNNDPVTAEISIKGFSRFYARGDCPDSGAGGVTPMQCQLLNHNLEKVTSIPTTNVMDKIFRNATEYCIPARKYPFPTGGKGLGINLDAPAGG